MARALAEDGRGSSVREPLTLASAPRVGALLLALGVVDDTIRFDRLGLEALFADTPSALAIEPFRGVDRVVSWFGSRDERFASKLRALAPDVTVAPSVPVHGLVWAHLLGTVTTGVSAEHPERAPIAVPERLVAEGRQVLTKIGWDGGRPLVMIHPGASGPAKQWSAEGFARVITALGARTRIVLHEGPLDGDAVRAVHSRVEASVHRLDDPALPVLAGALTHVDLFLGNDSGISHLAAAVGARCVVLFTSSAKLRWQSWAPGVETQVVTPRETADPDVRMVMQRIRRFLG